MQTPNQHGVYEPESREEVARDGRSYVAIEFCQCDDGLIRFSTEISYSIGGSSGPITKRGEGFSRQQDARDAALRKLIENFPKAWANEAQSVHDELRRMKAQIEQQFVQPSLF